MKTCLKQIARGLARLLIIPLYAIYQLQCIGLASISAERDRVFQGYSQLISLIPGRIGEYLRREFYRLTLSYCAADVVISFGTVFSTADVRLEEHVYLGAYCIIGRCCIARDTLVASRVSIVSGLRQHGISSTDVPIREQPGVKVLLEVGQDCWIGEGALVAASVGSQAVIGAGSVVLKDVQSLMVVGGNPAREIKLRGA